MTDKGDKKAPKKPRAAGPPGIARRFSAAAPRERLDHVVAVADRAYEGFRALVAAYPKDGLGYPVMQRSLADFGKAKRNLIGIVREMKERGEI